MSTYQENRLEPGGCSFAQLDQPPIFVVGAARSGTTWVSNILASPHQVAGIHESWLFTTNAGLATLFGEQHRAGLKNGLSVLLSDQDLVRHTREFSTKIMSHALQPHHRFLVEKSPSHAWSIEILNRLYPEAKFIHVLRDGRDVAVSVLAASKSWCPTWKNSMGSSVASSARNWQALIHRVNRKSEILEDRFLEVRYEEIRAHPFEYYQKLFDFCGIPWDDEMLKQVHDDTNFEHNYRPKENGFRRGGRVGDWRSRFSIWDAWRFDCHAGTTLLDLGYAEPNWWCRFPFRSYR